MNYLNIWYKEIVEMVRNRKALRDTLLIPLILGVFYAVLNPLLGEMITRRSEGVIGCLCAQRSDQCAVGRGFVPAFATPAVRAPLCRWALSGCTLSSRQ